MIIYDNQEYELSSFDSNFAISGGILFAAYQEETDTIYDIATEFTTVNNVDFPYKAKINGKYFAFSPSGTTSLGKYQLYCGSATIDQAGATEGDIATRNNGNDTIYMNLTSLNYRESVVIQVLNAMISHLEDPLSYSAATIKLLISKAFQFSFEFVNQAKMYRTANAHEESGEIITNAGDTVEALNAMTQKLEDIKAQTINIKNALDGTTASGVAAKNAAIATNIGNIDTAIGTVGTNTQNIASYLNTMKGHTSTMSTGVTTMATNSTNWGSSGSGGSSGSVDLSTIERFMEDISKALDGTDTSASTVASRLQAIVDKINSGDSAIATAITRKLATPESALIVEGTVDTDTLLFALNSGTTPPEIVFAPAYNAYMSGQLVLLKYPHDTNDFIYDMVTFCNSNPQYLRTQGGFLWTPSGNAVALTVTGDVSIQGIFTPDAGSPTFDDAVSYIQNGLPVVLSNSLQTRIVQSYTPSTQLLTTNGSPAWMWFKNSSE